MREEHRGRLLPHQVEAALRAGSSRSHRHHVSIQDANESTTAVFKPNERALVQSQEDLLVQSSLRRSTTLAVPNGNVDLERVLASIAALKSSPLIFLEAARIAEFAMSKRIPAISLFRVFPEAGGLMSYGPDIADLYRRCGVYAGRVLRGAKTSELPIERPARFF